MNQSKNSFARYQIGIALVFIILALSFLFNLWGNKRVIKMHPSVDPKYFSKDPVRLTKFEPVLIKNGALYRCNDCHKMLEPTDISKSHFSAHDDVVLEHGINNSCQNCHSKNDREKLVNIDGDDIAFNKSELLCQKCHGIQYRDWQGGAHGRINGSWDKSRAEMKKVSCVACHNPHSPKFKSMEPSPAPRLDSFLDSITIKDETHE